MVESEVLRVSLVEEQEKKAVELQSLEQHAARLMEVEKLLDECKVKLSQAEAELANYRQRSELERRFSELSGTPYVDKAPELEEKVKTLKEQLESLSTERVKIRGEILSGLTSVIVPVEANGRVDDSQERISFNFRESMKCPAITAFIKRELNFGLPPVYVALMPEGLKVVGVNDKTSALKELIKAVEALRAKAAAEVRRSATEALSGKQGEEEKGRGMLSPLKKFGKH